MNNQQNNLQPENIPQGYYPQQGQDISNQIPPSYAANINNVKQLIDQEIDKAVPKELSRWFGSIQYRPKRMKFATQNVGEKIYILVRMHWIRNLGWIMNNIFYANIPFVILLILQLLKTDIQFLSLRLFVILLLAYYSIIFTNIIRQFYDWYYDVYIVTNERILDYTFSPFRGYEVTEAPLASIEDVEERSLGLLADLFNYGTIKARTASNAGELSFDYIADPTRVRDIIMDLAKIIKMYRYGD